MLAKMSLCSAEEDGGSLDVEDHDDLHSPTDVSEDSVEVRVKPIVIPAAKASAKAALAAAKRKQPAQDGRGAEKGFSGAPSGPSGAGQHSQHSQQRNYKNMTRERRIEANARERTRVHTISAAFDTLRRSVPAYSHSQKLSKLSVLRIACSYILTLSRVAGMDYSEDQSSPAVEECVDQVTRTIQTEGKLRRKRDE
ncbi:protein atonal homolog 8-like [Thrips palmi]|uniref:Protein atonal homolog 8-like n=1 Tax=Thrips palmi TaxID=161013 RepID=A0A6P9AMS4_THRPL|nr:protein atonal homolog 8-like [Thrips palmi]